MRGETVRGVAAAMGVNASSVLKALDRGRQPGTPSYLKRMAQACDSNRDTRKRLRLDLSAAMAQYETDLHPDGRWPEQTVPVHRPLTDHSSAFGTLQPGRCGERSLRRGLRTGPSRYALDQMLPYQGANLHLPADVAGSRDRHVSRHHIVSLWAMETARKRLRRYSTRLRLATDRI